MEYLRLSQCSRGKWTRNIIWVLNQYGHKNVQATQKGWLIFVLHLSHLGKKVLFITITKENFTIWVKTCLC